MGVKDWMGRNGVTGAVVAGVLVMAGLAYADVTTTVAEGQQDNQQLAVAEDDRTRLAEGVDDNYRVAQLYRKRLQERGVPLPVDPATLTEPEELVEDPDDIQQAAPPPVDGTPLDSADVAVLVANCFASGKCEQPLDPEQLTGLFAKYCNAEGRCKPKPGKRGKQGPPPTFNQVLAAVEEACDGTCKGQQGDAPSEEQLNGLITDVFTAYCAPRNGCIGPSGADSQVPGPAGPAGRSAYEIAVANGYTGTVTDWLASLVGNSAYEVAVANGFQGSRAQWLASLEGPAGKDGADGKDGRPGKDVRSVVCSTTVPGEFDFTFTLSDGTRINASCSGGQIDDMPPEQTPEESRLGGIG